MSLHQAWDRAALRLIAPVPELPRRMPASTEVRLSDRTRYRETPAHGGSKAVVERKAGLAEHGPFGRFVAGAGDRQHRRGWTDPAINLANIVQQGEAEHPSCPIRIRPRQPRLMGE